MFEKTFNRVYRLSEGGTLSPRVNPQEIALVFIIMAQGTLYNIEMPNYDPSAEDWLHLSERALVEGNFLSNNMVAGLQTLVSFRDPCADPALMFLASNGAYASVCNLTQSFFVAYM